jgi:hypothetical protein
MSVEPPSKLAASRHPHGRRARAALVAAPFLPPMSTRARPRAETTASGRQQVFRLGLLHQQEHPGYTGTFERAAISPT